MIIKQHEHKNKNAFLSSDLALVAFISLYFPIINIDLTNPKKAIFYFEDSPNLQNLISDYWNNNITVEPKSYFQQLKIIKSRLYTEGRYL